ncbi:MAG: radical SAM protein [Aquidulcibacter sp.]|nr:radical SAM protein [Aquidulcibacter sp.]
MDQVMQTTLSPLKFQDPLRTAKGEERACVAFDRFQTLWFNTGTLCNITCVNCYIESSPTNDRLVYLTPQDVVPFLDELAAVQPGAVEIGFTGGEPFLNPDILEILTLSLERGHPILLLTNAMRPMMRPRVREGIARLITRFGDQLTFRISLDHWSAHYHDQERGEGGFEETCQGIDWLAAQGAKLAIAGRTLWGESQEESQAGFHALVAARNWPIDVDQPLSLVLFPEMDARVDVPEITPACWGILGVDPKGLMCASSRMIVKRKGAVAPIVLPCTLLPYDTSFEMGTTLASSLGSVRLNHPHCAKFCVLGGGSCSA